MRGDSLLSVVKGTLVFQLQENINIARLGGLKYVLNVLCESGHVIFLIFFSGENISFVDRHFVSLISLLL